MAVLQMGTILEHKDRNFSVRESLVHRNPTYTWFKDKEAEKERDPNYWEFGENNNAGVHLSAHLVNLLRQDEIAEVVYQLYNLTEEDDDFDGIHVKLLNYTKKSDTYYDEYNDDFLRFLRDAVERKDKDDLKFLVMYENILSIIRGSRIFKFSEMLDIWKRNKETLLKKSVVEYNDAASLVNNLLRLEYLDMPLYYNGEINTDFKFAGGGKIGLYDKRTKGELLDVVHDMNCVIAKYEEVNRTKNRLFPSDTMETGNVFLDKMWEHGSGVAYRKFLYRDTKKPTHKGLADFVKNGTPEEHLIVTEFGLHVAKSKKYIKAIATLLEQNKDLLPAGRMTHREYTKTRFFNNKFLLALLDIPFVEDVGLNRTDFDSINEELAYKLMAQSPFLNGYPSEYSGYLSDSSLYDRKSIVKQNTDLNYVVALLINNLGVVEGIELLIKAVETHFRSGIPTASQWERYIKECTEGEYDKLPFEWGMDMVSQRRK